MQIHSLDTIQGATDTAQAALYLAISNADTPILFLASGGSALQLLNKPLHASNITLSVLDERFSTDPDISNYLQLKETTLFKTLEQQSKASLSTVPYAYEEVSEWATRIELQIISWQKENPEGKIVATLGMGKDGHIAGIFPLSNEGEFTNNFINTPRFIHAYRAPAAPACNIRLTVTLPFLKRIDTCLAFICGSDKRESLMRALNPIESAHTTPARLLQSIPNITIFTDLLIKPR